MNLHHRQSEKGSVFIVVLAVSLALVSMALVFGHSMLMAWRGSDNDLAGRQADQAIEGAARYAESLMAKVTNPGDLPDPTSYQSEALPVGDSKFWFIGVLSATSVVTQPAFGLVDEASKLNLNTASSAMLQQLPGMTPDLSTSIITWRNTATDQTASTAGTITSMGPVKNAPFESVEELALLTGTDSTILYGEDASLNHALDPNEDDSDATAPPDNADGKLDSGLMEYVTVFSREPNKRADGSARINVTDGRPPGSRTLAAPLKLLLTNALAKGRDNEIEQNAGSGPFRNPLEFYIRSKMTEEEFGKIAADLTWRGGNFITGLVNVNTASQTVLACIVGADNASKLIAERLTKTTPSTNLAWIVKIIGETAAVQAGTYLTTRSYQVSADVAAVGHHGRGYRRTLFVIDSSTGTPRIVYRRNLASLGWALGSSARDMLTAKKDTP